MTDRLVTVHADRRTESSMPVEAIDLMPRLDKAGRMRDHELGRVLVLADIGGRIPSVLAGAACPMCEAPLVRFVMAGRRFGRIVRIETQPTRNTVGKALVAPVPAELDILKCEPCDLAFSVPSGS